MKTEEISIHLLLNETSIHEVTITINKRYVNQILEIIAKEIDEIKRSFDVSTKTNPNL